MMYCDFLQIYEAFKWEAGQIMFFLSKMSPELTKIRKLYVQLHVLFLFYPLIYFPNFSNRFNCFLFEF